VRGELHHRGTEDTVEDLSLKGPCENSVFENAVENRT
jgi:hypothetical protein